MENNISNILNLNIRTDETICINCQSCDAEICVPSDLQLSTSYVICPKCVDGDESMLNLNYAPFVAKSFSYNY